MDEAERLDAPGEQLDALRREKKRAQRERKAARHLFCSVEAGDRLEALLRSPAQKRETFQLLTRKQRTLVRAMAEALGMVVTCSAGDVHVDKAAPHDRGPVPAPLPAAEGGVQALLQRVAAQREAQREAQRAGPAAPRGDAGGSSGTGGEYVKITRKQKRLRRAAELEMLRPGEGDEQRGGGGAAPASAPSQAAGGGAGPAAEVAPLPPVGWAIDRGRSSSLPPPAAGCSLVGGGAAMVIGT